MSLEKFTPDELTPKSFVPTPFGPPVAVLSTPISYKENVLRMYAGKIPMWAPFSSGDITRVMAYADPERVARSKGDGTPRTDGWGVDWIFVDVAGGAMVKPGKPLVTDINRWEEQVKSIPDPDTWDWEAAYEKVKGSIDDEHATMVTNPGCLFERLIALMDFENAAVALIDDEQKEGVHRLFRAVTDIHKKMYYYIRKYFHTEIANFNDDWGSQRAEFFSEETAREMLFPYIKEMCDYVHSLGMYWDLHCCGFVEGLVGLFAEAGYDSWGGQPMNDKYKLKKLYGDKMLFTGHINCPPGTPVEEQDKIIREFFDTIGEDNRVFVEPNRDCPEGFRERIYEASRRNYDRLVAEGRVTD